jgi:hypothetical protein
MLTAFSLVSALMLAMGSLAQAAEVIEIGCKEVISIYLDEGTRSLATCLGRLLRR